MMHFYHVILATSCANVGAAALPDKPPTPLLREPRWFLHELSKREEYPKPSEWFAVAYIWPRFIPFLFSSSLSTGPLCLTSANRRRQHSIARRRQSSASEECMISSPYSPGEGA